MGRLFVFILWLLHFLPLPILACVAVAAVSVVGAILVAEDKAAPLLAMI